MKLSYPELAVIAAVAFWLPNAAAQSPTQAPPTSADFAVPAEPPPLVRIPPEYPARALSRGTSGWVTLRFTITTSGSVEDVVVVSSEPGTEFDDAARRAVEQWRYAPPPGELRGVTTTIDFSLGSGGSASAPRSTRARPPAQLPIQLRRQGQLFARQLEVCDISVSRRDRTPEYRDLCRYLDDPPSLATILQIPSRPASLGEAIWLEIVVPMALAEPADARRLLLYRMLELDDQAEQLLATRARDAVDQESISWSRLEQQALCQQPESFASGEALYQAVDAIHGNLVSVQERLVSELLASLDPALAERVEFHGAGYRAVSSRMDVRQPLREWSGRRLQTARAALCP